MQVTYYYGFDLSTSCIGITILNNEGTPIELNYIKLPSKLDFFSKADVFKTSINQLFNKYKPTDIYVEDYFKKFNIGYSSANTIVVLARFNGIASYIIKNLTNIVPTPISVFEARKLLGFKKQRDENIKEAILNFVQNILVNQKIVNLSYLFDKTKTDKPKPYSYDLADSYIIARAGYVSRKNS